jgi:phosphoribosylformimino-5-aminoimidazole carboxamide ribotide isomerase
LYEKDNLTGGHVIMLGADSASRASARKALTAWPGGLQLGGSVNSDNASSWIDAGASHVIVTSFIFDKGVFMSDKLTELVAAVGKGHLVLDLSCRKSKEDGRYYVVTDRWQKFSQLVVDQATLEMLADSCDEFLVHGVEVEGMQLGIDEELVSILGQYSPIPVTYAGGARSISDLETVKRAGGGRVDITVGSALDIFGGQLAYDDVVAWHKSQVDGGDGGEESSHVSVAAANQDDDGKMGMTQDDGTILYRF